MKRKSRNSSKKYKSAVITMAKYSRIFPAIIVIVSIIIKLLEGLGNENKWWKFIKFKRKILEKLYQNFIKIVIIFFFL